jgi:glycosyltransferase involved in cell wall biosynthesis
MIRVTQFVRRPGASSFSMERLFEDVRGHLPGDIEVRVCTSRFISRGVFRRLYDSLRAAWHQGQVNHVTGDVHFLTYFLRRRRTLLTIHDCVPLHRTRGLKRWLLWLFWFWLPARRCALISVISEATRRQVLDYGYCDPDSVRVVFDNVSEEFRPLRRRFNTDCPRVLQVGTSPNKNLERHAAALEGINCRFVIIGEVSETQRAALARHSIRYENHVGLSRAEVVEQYEQCDLVLFASTYEGFGLPIVEAQAVGRPVVTSDAWSMPEVAGNAACLVDPYDVESIRAGVRRVVSDFDYREQLIANGFENVARFRPDVVAEQYATLYREIQKNGT